MLLLKKSYFRLKFFGSNLVCCLHPQMNSILLFNNRFNPPFFLSVKTNIGRTFLKLLKQYFPKSNRLHKIFNNNTMKVSYSFMSNMSSIISLHNKRLLQPRINEYGCNCRTRENCPLQNQCLTPNLIYRADVENIANNYNYNK